MYFETGYPGGRTGDGDASMVNTPGAAVVDAAVAVSHLESHQRPAIEQIDATPVPARRFGREVGTRPLVIEPGAAGQVAAVHLADSMQLRSAVVVARLLRAMPLAAEARFALQHRLAGEQRQVELDVASADARLVAITLELQPPVVDRRRSVGSACASENRAPRAGRQSRRAGRERRMREMIPRIEAARLLLCSSGRAKERDLEGAAIQPSGDVPPLGAELKSAVIARKRRSCPRRVDRRRCPPRKEAARPSGRRGMPCVASVDYPMACATVSSSPMFSPPSVRGQPARGLPDAARSGKRCSRSRANSTSPTTRPAAARSAQRCARRTSRPGPSSFRAIPPSARRRSWSIGVSRRKLHPGRGIGPIRLRSRMGASTHESRWRSGRETFAGGRG